MLVSHVSHLIIVYSHGLHSILGFPRVTPHLHGFSAGPLGDWCITPILLRPAIKSHLRGCRSRLILYVSIDTPAVSSFASIHISVTQGGRAATKVCGDRGLRIME